MNAREKFDERLIKGAHDYAAANKSDPFALARALTHVRNGLCGGRQEDGSPTGYQAEAFNEIRRLEDGATFSDGTNEYAVTVYRNIKRP